ncbi:MAG: hypothetical protein R6T87_13200, partial [Marinobacter sp.]
FAQTSFSWREKNITPQTADAALLSVERKQRTERVFTKTILFLWQSVPSSGRLRLKLNKGMVGRGLKKRGAPGMARPSPTGMYSRAFF